MNIVLWFFPVCAFVLPGSSAIGAAPANDDFVHAQELAGPLPLTVAVSTKGATREPLEPVTPDDGNIFPADHAQGTVWFRWLTPVAGAYEVVTRSKEVRVFIGNDLAGLTDIHGPRFRAEAGGLCWFRFENGEETTLTLQALAQGNDDFANAAETLWRRGLLPLHLVGDCALAGREVGEPGTEPATLWWRTTVPETGSYYLSGTAMALYRGTSLASLERVPDGLEQGKNGLAHIVQLIAGETLYLQSGGAFQSWVEVVLGRQGPAAGNDDFATPVVLPSALPALLDAGTTMATVDAAESIFGENRAGMASWWWLWTAVADGAVELALPADSGVETAYVCEGPQLTQLVQAAWVIPASGQGHTRFRTVAGHTYRIRLGASRHFNGRIKASLYPVSVPVPANDSIAAAEAIPSLPFEPVADMSMASLEPGEPQDVLQPHHRGSLWWRWTAPEAGVYAAQNCQVFRGDSIGSLTAVQPLKDPQTEPSEIVFGMAAGESVSLALIHPGQGSQAAFRLRALPVSTNTATESALELGSASYRNLEIIPVQYAARPEILPNSGTYYWQWTAPAEGTVYFYGRGTGLRNVTLTPVPQVSDFPADPAVVKVPDWPTLFAATVRAGQRYLLAVETGTSPYASCFMVHVPPPSNDGMSQAVNLGRQRQISGTAWTGGATAENREPSRFVEGPQHSVWWRWTAPGSGFAVLKQLGITQVWMKPDSNVLTKVPVPQFMGESRAFQVEAGREYWLCEDHTETISGPVNWELSYTDPNPHDFFAARAKLDSARHVTFNCQGWGVTTEPGEPDAARTDRFLNPAPNPFSPRYGSPRAGSFWLEWTAPQDGFLRVSDWSFPFISEESLVIYAGSDLTRLTRLPEGLPSVKAGETYCLAVYSRWTEDHQIDLQLHPVPVNDAFAGRLPLSLALEAWPPAPERIGGVTLEPDEPADTEVSGGSVWWTFTAPHDGRFNFSVSSLEVGLPCEAAIRIFRGTTLNTLALVAATPTTESTADRREVFLDAAAGENFQVQAGTPTGSASRVAFLEVSREEPPPPVLPQGRYDMFADALVLPATLPLRLGTVPEPGSYTLEEGESALPRHSTATWEGSRWFRWTPVVTGPVMLRCGTTLPAWEVYSGNSLGTLTIPQSLDGIGLDVITFRAEAGVSYYLRLNGRGGDAQAWLEPLWPQTNTTEATATVLTGDIPLVLEGSPYNSPGGALWWKWTPPHNVFIYLQSQVGEATLSVEGNTLTAMKGTTLVAGKTYSFQLQAKQSFDLRPDVEKLRAIQKVVVAAVPRPENTTTESATVLPSLNSAHDSVLVPAGTTGPHWWRWRAPAGGRLNIPSYYVTPGMLYRNGVSLSFSNNIIAQAGDEFLFGRNLTDPNSNPVFTNLFLTPAKVSASDLLAEAWLFDARYINSSGTLTADSSASAEPGEPAHGGVPASHSIWRLWRTPDPGWFSAMMDSTLGRTALYRCPRGIPESMDDLELILPNPTPSGSFGGRYSRLVTWPVRAGDWLAIAVESDAASNTLLRVAFRASLPSSIPRQDNDDFKNAEPLFTSWPSAFESRKVQLHGKNADGNIVTSTLEPAEPLPPPGWSYQPQRSCWFSLQLPDSFPLESLRMKFRFEPDYSNEIALQFYLGETLESLMPVRAPLQGFYQNQGSGETVLTKKTMVYLQLITTANVESVVLKYSPTTEPPAYTLWQSQNWPSPLFRGSNKDWLAASRLNATVFDDVPFGFRYLFGIPATRALTAADRLLLPQPLISADRLALRFRPVRFSPATDAGTIYGEWLEPALTDKWQGPIEPLDMPGQPGYQSVSVPVVPGKTRFLRLRYLGP